MAQVKFYSVSANDAKTDAGGIYFVTGGELYKGTSRFGANKVFTVPANTTITGETDAEKLASALTAAGVSANNANAIGGDILTGYGAAKVFNGTTWVDLGQDQAALDNQLKSLVAGLAFDPTNGSYIAGIEQDSDTGAVTARIGDFGQDVKKAVGDGAASSTANGITVSVTTTSGSVTGVQVDATNISATSVTANTGTFTNLTVSDTATFSATTVSASSLTIGGSTVEQLADKQIAAIAASTVTSTATGITVSVTTKGGSVTAVSLNAESFANAMHFLGVGSVAKTSSGVDVTPPAGKIPVAGDIVIDSNSGLEAICTGTDPSTTWELIGDNAVYALNAYTSTAYVYSGVNTVAGALNAVGAKADTFQAELDAKVTYSDNVSDPMKAGNLVTAQAVVNYVAQEITALNLGTAAQKDATNTLTANGTSLPTESAVAAYVSTVIGDLAGSANDADKGVSVEVVTSDGEVSTVNVSVTAASQMAFGATGSSTELATTAAVKDFYDNNLVWLDAYGTAIA